MSKKAVPDDFMDSFMSGKDPQKTDKDTTTDPQATDERPTRDVQKTPLERYQFRLHPEDWRRLQDHFEARGISVSAGIRMIIREYLDRERVG